MKNTHTHRWAAWCLGALPAVALGAGFQIQEQNASNLGTAYSGAGSSAHDASTAFYNPAALTQTGSQQYAQSLVFAHANMHLDIHTAHSNTGTPADGVYNDTLTHTAPLPSFHYAQRLGPRTVFGLSAVAPFGVKSEYNANSAARYLATKSSLMSFVISPSLAYQCGAAWSVAAGFDAGYVLAELDANLGVGDWQTDGRQTNQASDWGLGWHAGVWYTPTEHTRMGLNLRSRIPVNAQGDSVTYLSGFERRQTLSAEVDLPESVLLSIARDISQKTSWMADVQWTHWSRFDVLQLKYTSVYDALAIETINVAEVPENFRNTFRASFGMEHAYSNDWLFKAGVAYDPSPTREGFRTARIPDANRVWVAAGLRRRLSHKAHLDIGYAHLFFQNVHVVDHGPVASGTGLPLTASYMEADYQTQADVLGVQISWNLL